MGRKRIVMRSRDPVLGSSSGGKDCQVRGIPMAPLTGAPVSASPQKKARPWEAAHLSRPPRLSMTELSLTLKFTLHEHILCHEM